MTECTNIPRDLREIQSTAWVLTMAMTMMSIQCGAAGFVSAPGTSLIFRLDSSHHLPTDTGQNCYQFSHFYFLTRNYQLDILPSFSDGKIYWNSHPGWKEKNNFALFSPNRRFGSKISAPCWTLDEICPENLSKDLSYRIYVTFI